MSIKVSVLNKKELRASSAYTIAIVFMSKLNKKELDNVIKRLTMLHMLDEDEADMLTTQLWRISQ
jgi:hypothetical protein